MAFVTRLNQWTENLSRRRFVSGSVVLVYILSLVVYMANGRGIAFVDTGPARHLTLSLIRDHDLDLNELRPYLPELELSYVTKEVDGNLVSQYPVGSVFLAAPYYIMAMFAGLSPDQFEGLAKLEKWAGANIGALLAALYWVLLRRRTTASLGVRIIVWLAFAFGSANWVLNSQGLWQHGPLQIFEILALLAFPPGLEGKRRYLRLMVCGLLLGLAGFMRPTGYVLIPVWGLYLFSKNFRFAIAYGCGVIIGFLPQILYNLTYIPSGSGGYFHLIFANNYFSDLRPLHNFTALLFNPSRGLIIFCPIFILLLLWAFRSARKYARPGIPPALLALSSLGIFTVYLGFQIWWQGWCYGPRFLSDILPFLFLLLVPPLQYLMLRRRAIAAAALTFILTCTAWSIGVQAVGAMHYDGGWDGRVQLAAVNDVAWDWRDNIIADAWSGGVDPYARLNSPDYYTVNPVRIYRLGKQESHQFFFSGFYDQEGWGTWSRGALPGVMLFQFNAGPGTLYISGLGTGSNYAPARFDILLNDHLVKKGKIEQYAFAGWKKKVLEIPLKEKYLTGGIERLTIISHDAGRAAPTGRFYGMGVNDMLYVPNAMKDTATTLVQEMHRRAAL